MEKGYDILEVLGHINPTHLQYQDWINVGMALKEEGYSVNIWDNWSCLDSRYHSGECSKKWNSFRGNASPVTAGTIVQLAKEQGWEPEHGYELDWNNTIEKDELVIIDKNWIEAKEVEEPKHWNPTEQLIKYLESLFDSTENVGYVTHSFEKDGKFMPTKGCWDRTAGELIQKLNNSKGDIGAVIGDCNPIVGAWIRFNPLDGKGCKNDNVTEFRYALVESDTLEIEKQNAVIRELELPVACLVHSGGKSLHAVVRVDAADYHEYRKRVDYLYHMCNKNGLNIDSQNRNPSRLSRMPGIIRNGNKQFLVDTNIGKSNWNEWYEWIESVNDDLPDPESMADVWDNLPELSQTLIDGLLRQGHKMLIAGPSKAGKSFALIELCIAIAEGRKWLGSLCAQGKIMYVNLELDRSSCLHRFKDVYETMGIPPKNLANIDIWNLRGKSVPLDKLAPNLIRRALKKNYIAIIIDPIYKVITGDENSADQMAKFCNQFDKICTELGTAVIYCHHHSKGSQGGKRSMDRASGSGVFARDPDALIDLIELELTEANLKQEENKAICKSCKTYLDAHFAWQDDLSQDDLCSSVKMLEYCKDKLSKYQISELNQLIDAAKTNVRNLTAWRMEGTLREFPKFEPINLWFDYPVHSVDQVGILKDIKPEETAPAWKKNFERKKSPEEAKEERKKTLEVQFESLKSFNKDGNVTVKELAESMGTTEKTIRNRIKEHGSFWVDEGNIGKK